MAAASAARGNGGCPASLDATANPTAAPAAAVDAAIAGAAGPTAVLHTSGAAGMDFQFIDEPVHVPIVDPTGDPVPVLDPTVDPVPASDADTVTESSASDADADADAVVVVPDPTFNPVTAPHSVPPAAAAVAAAAGSGDGGSDRRRPLLGGGGCRDRGRGRVAGCGGPNRTPWPYAASSSERSSRFWRSRPTTDARRFRSVTDTGGDRRVGWNSGSESSESSLLAPSSLGS